MKWKASFIATAVFGAVVGILELFCPLYRSHSAAMAPTILAGDGVAVYRYAYRSAAPKRGDIIAFRDARSGSVLLFRIVALPGETAEVRSKRLFVNGVEQEEPFAEHRDDRLFPKRNDVPEPYRSRDHFGPLGLQAGEYFVLGDNRDQSFDSRFLGPVAFSKIVGRCVRVFHLGHEIEPQF